MTLASEEAQVYRSSRLTVLAFVSLCGLALVGGGLLGAAGWGSGYLLSLLGLVLLVWVLSHGSIVALEVGTVGVRDRMWFMRTVPCERVERVRVRRALGSPVLEIAVSKTFDCGLTFLGWLFSRIHTAPPKRLDAELFNYNLTFFHAGGDEMIAAIERFVPVEGR